VGAKGLLNARKEGFSIQFGQSRLGDVRVGGVRSKRDQHLAKIEAPVEQFAIQIQPDAQRIH
jgi:hypothetical protein